MKASADKCNLGFTSLQRVCTSAESMLSKKSKEENLIWKSNWPSLQNLDSKCIHKTFRLLSFLQSYWNYVNNKVFVWLSKVTESNFDLMNNVTSFCEGCLYKFKEVPFDNWNTNFKCNSFILETTWIYLFKRNVFFHITN